MHKKVHPAVWLVSALLLLLAAAGYYIVYSGFTSAADIVGSIPTPVLCTKSFEKPNLGETGSESFQNEAGNVTVSWSENGDVTIVLRHLDKGKTTYLFEKNVDQWNFYVDSHLSDVFTRDDVTTTYSGEYHLFRFADGFVTGYTKCSQ